jgi:hypothetical protein
MIKPRTDGEENKDDPLHMIMINKTVKYEQIIVKRITLTEYLTGFGRD